jgi:hypothetical protein
LPNDDKRWNLRVEATPMPAVRRALPLLVIAAAACGTPRPPAVAPIVKEPAPTAKAAEPAPAPEPESKEAKTEIPIPPADPEPAVRAEPEKPKLTITLDDGKTAACREQAAQSFLIRSSWFPATTDAEKVKEGRKLLDDAIKYRTEKYGYFEGFGRKSWNPHPPKHYAKGTKFMGMPVQVHERIIPALKCVEAALKATAAGKEYTPRAMGGIRFSNTYRGVEVSNHVYGIAVDIEPDRNTCCGCVPPWNEHALCKDKKRTIWQRMAMPKSWVDTFERYGFYWLGHDVLQDTMHFEFLGDPDKILEPAKDAPVATR